MDNTGKNELNTSHNEIEIKIYVFTLCPKTLNANLGDRLIHYEMHTKMTINLINRCFLNFFFPATIIQYRIQRGLCNANAGSVVNQNKQNRDGQEKRTCRRRRRCRGRGP